MPSFSVVLVAIIVSAYTLALLAGINQCFFGVRAAIRRTKLIYGIALFCATTFFVVPVCWLFVRALPVIDERFALIALTIIATGFAIYVAGKHERIILQIYGALIGLVFGITVGAFLIFAFPVGRSIIAIVCWVGGAVLGWHLTKLSYDFARILLFASSGSALISQSIVGIKDFIETTNAGGLIFKKFFELLFPVLKIILSASWLEDLAFLFFTALLFIGGVTFQCKDLKSINADPNGTAACDAIAALLKRWKSASR